MERLLKFIQHQRRCFNLDFK